MIKAFSSRYPAVGQRAWRGGWAHGLCVVGVPPCAGEFEVFLDQGTIGAFDFAGADGEVGFEGSGVVELSGAKRRMNF
jgi:hypothetical protein